MIEIWVDIKGFEGAYQVSTFGNVKSLDRTVTNRTGVSRVLSGKLLKPQKCSNKYLFVNLGLGRSRLIHRLVAKAFLDNPYDLPQVNHINGIKSDNNITNLEWVSCSDNHKHSYSNLNRKLHSKSKVVVISKSDIEHNFNGCNEAASFLGVSPGSISSAVKNNHKCRGWVVRYETCKVERFREFEMAKLSRQRCC